MKEFVTHVLTAARTGLVDYGFKKRSGDIFTRDVDVDVLGWVGLNRAVRRGQRVLEINPVVGVRHQPTELLLAELRQEKFHPYVPPTFSVHLGYLMPDCKYTPWLFPLGKDTTSELHRLVQNIGEFSVSFVQRNTRLPDLGATIEQSEFGVPEQIQFRLPVMYLLLERRRLAEKYITKQLIALGDREDSAAEHYRHFADAVRIRLRDG